MNMWAASLSLSRFFFRSMSFSLLECGSFFDSTTILSLSPIHQHVRTCTLFTRKQTIFTHSSLLCYCDTRYGNIATVYRFPCRQIKTTGCFWCLSIFSTAATVVVHRRRRWVEIVGSNVWVEYSNEVHTHVCAGIHSLRSSYTNNMPSASLSCRHGNIHYENAAAAVAHRMSMVLVRYCCYFSLLLFSVLHSISTVLFGLHAHQ